MIKVLLSLLILSGCSSRWKQKDFEKEIDKPAAEATAKVETTKDEAKLIEKFEVLDSSQKVVEEKPVAKKVITKKVVVKKEAGKPAVTKVVQVPVAEPKPKVKTTPKDYPPELVELNNKAKKVWDLYKPNHPVDKKVFLDIHYLGMTVGKIMVTNKGKKMINGKEVWHLHARFKSAPFYSNIYELDDTVDTYVTTDQFLSIKYSLIQRESKQDVDDLQLHDRDQFKTFWFYHQKKSDGKIRDKKLDSFIPYFSLDPFSVLFFYQGLPLKNGDVYEIPLINKTKLLTLRSVVEGREKITLENDKEVNAIRVHATTKYTGETLKSGDLYFWFSDDDQRTMLKAQAKIKIGSVTADIVDK